MLTRKWASPDRRCCSTGKCCIVMVGGGVRLACICIILDIWPTFFTSYFIRPIVCLDLINLYNTHCYNVDRNTDIYVAANTLPSATPTTPTYLGCKVSWRGCRSVDGRRRRQQQQNIT